MRHLTKHVTPATVMSVLVTLTYSVHAQATAFTETDDADESPSTAQVIPPESSLLESISGTLSGFDDPADLFQIFLTGGQSFSATTVGGAEFDTRLFLFDANGAGVYFNDDASSDTLQSTLPANSSFTPTESGTYYLGISGFDYNPVNTEGDRIFPTLADFPIDTPSDTIFTGVYGPTGPGGNSVLGGFDGAILDEGGSYAIALTGVQTGAESIPEPTSALALFVVAASGAVLQQRIKPRKEQANRQQSII